MERNIPLELMGVMWHNNNGTTHTFRSVGWVYPNVLRQCISQMTGLQYDNIVIEETHHVTSPEKEEEGCIVS